MMSLLTVPEDEGRHNRLAAIARLEQQHKMRRSHIEQEGQEDPTSPRAGKYFLLLISKGSGNLQQRANQDRVETMLSNYPHEILDGSNVAFDTKRDELFELSNIRGNYPQLFVVDNGVTTFVGDFDTIEYHNDGGTLGTLVESHPGKSPKKKPSIVKTVKKMGKMLKKSSSLRKDINGALGDSQSPSKSSSHTASTEPLSSRSLSMVPKISTEPLSSRSLGMVPKVSTDPLSSRSLSMVPKLSSEPLSSRSFSMTPRSSNGPIDGENATQRVSNRTFDESANGGSPENEGEQVRRLSADLGLASSSPLTFLEEEIKPASTGWLVMSTSDGDMPLEGTGKKEKKSKTKGRSKDLKRSSSKSKNLSASDGALALNDEDGDNSKSPKKGSKSSSKSRSRSKSASKYKSKGAEGEQELKDEEKGEKSEPMKRRSRSHSRGKLGDSTKSSREREKSRSRSHSRGAKDTTKSSKAGDEKRLSRSRSTGAIGLRDSKRSSSTGGEERRSRSRSTSARGGQRSTTKSSKDEGEMDLKVEGDETKSRKKSSRSKSTSKRSMRNVDTEGKEAQDEDAKDGEGSKHRKSRSRRESISKDEEGVDSPTKPKSQTKLREKDAEKHPRRRTGVRSASPHKLREKTQGSESGRSNSPGKRRGDIARRREAMKEFREKKSHKHMDDDDVALMSPKSSMTKPRKLMSASRLEVPDTSRLLSPRRHKSLMPSSEKGSGAVDESLSDLVKRVKDKDKKSRIEEDDEDEETNAGSVVPSVQW